MLLNLDSWAGELRLNLASLPLGSESWMYEVASYVVK